MTTKEKKLFFAAGLVFASRALFFYSFFQFLDVVLGNNEHIVKPIGYFIAGSGVGYLGFYLTGASKLAWLQLPHQASALIGVGLVFGCAFQIFNGTAIPVTYLLFFAGLFFIGSWWYFAKHNKYRA
ncbi:hypothetical protein [Cellvibrio sp. NN19]|uniref:hypothetical protein n=1 Tax=Cellvibrio chitinivorans TaxID=3102792 RepID=UPI002B40C12F|nr:hypothetical protein [Cellvibrio sp. NN19]